jgi:hypothetical protein
MNQNPRDLDGKIEKPATPEVRFEISSVQEEIDIIFKFCMHKNPTLDFSDAVYSKHPELKNMVAGITDEKLFHEQCEKYVRDYLEKNKDAIGKSKEHFQKAWEQVGGLFLESLCKDFETDLPEEIKEIKANVSINPMCPRWIDRWTFNLYYKFSDSSMEKVSIHEIIHFLYFKKWLEVFPGADKKNFNGMNSEWILSEILVHTIMNNNKAIQDIVKGEKADVYKKWQSIVIDGKRLAEYFDDLYIEHKEGKISFAEFLKKSWDRYNKNKDLIEDYIKK